MYNSAGIHSEDLQTSPPEFSSLVELLRRRALRQPDEVGYIFLVDGETEQIQLTYGELDRKARAIAALLQSSHAVGERALLLYPSGLDYIAAFFGCLYAQVVAVPAYPPRLARADRKLPRISAIANNCKPQVALCTASTQSILAPLLDGNPALQGMQLIATDNLSDEWAERWQEPVCTGETLAFLQYTSGSTSTPKGVMVTHGNLLHNERLIKQAFQQTERSVIVGWLPLYHDMGLIGNILQPLYLGAPCILMSPTAFLQSPYRWLRAISQYKATTSGAPNFAYDLCVRKISPEQRATLDLSSWTTAFNGAEPVREETLKRFAETFAPQGFREESFSPCYGLAEATLIVTGGVKAGPHILHTVRRSRLESHAIVTASAEDADTQTLVSCGQALLDQKVIIVDPESATLAAPDSVGEIWVAGPSVAQGYWDMPEETERTFRAYLADTGEGPFLRTGDLGYLNNNQLFVTGRLKDLIIIRGRNHYPQDIELTVERSHAALRPGGGAAFSVELAGEERLVVVQEVEHRRVAGLNVAEVVDAIRQALAEEHELQVHTVVFIKPGTIPKTSSGKIQRHAARVKFQEGTLDVIGEWRASAPSEIKELSIEPDAPLQSLEDVEAWLKLQLAAKLRMDASEIDINQPIARYGVDSLTAIELTHSIEARLGVTLPVVSFLQSPSIGELASRLMTELAASPSSEEVSIASSDNLTAEHPLSYGQRSLYFLYQLAPDSSAYNIGGAVRIHAEVDAGAMRRAFRTLVERHASLRTIFITNEEGLPVQLVQEQAEVCFQEEDARDWTEESLQQRLAEEANRPFKLDEGPLLRVMLCKRAAREYVLSLTMHHIVADFWSLAVLVNELGILYLAERTGTRISLAPVTLQYSDYARWQQELLNGAGAARLQEYWERQLAGELPVLNLPTDHPRPPVQSLRGASHPFHLSAELAEELRAVCRRQGVTLYMMLLAAFQVMLHRYTGQESLLVGSPTAGRTLAGLSGLVGYFVNPVVLKAELSGDRGFAEFLGQVRQTVLSAFEHQDYPFALLVERLQPERDPSRSPIFQTMFVLQKSHLHDEGLASFALGEAGAKMELGGLPIESIAPQQRSAQFDLTLMVSETPGTMAATLEYSTDLFEAATIARMSAHFTNLLESIVRHPEQSISELEMLSAQEQRQLLVEWNQTAEEYDAACLHYLIEAQVERTPDAVAVSFNDEQVTYRELNERANQIAHHLRSLGVRAETRVGILMERSIDLVVALLGTLKSGAAYVPLDPNYPQQRLSFMLSDSQADVLLSREQFLSALPDYSGHTLLMESFKASASAPASANPETEVLAENLAYLIYTSGSTGRPKGVAITHRNAAALLHWAQRAFSREELSSVLA
ncbi:MAG TPA: AMP-binding protein, partial [Pyrinomonadaceae bacterium]|nr:AMP-binding protein [Pyrinomonadaceae bacterium]